MTTITDYQLALDCFTITIAGLGLSCWTLARVIHDKDRLLDAYADSCDATTRALEAHGVYRSESQRYVETLKSLNEELVRALADVVTQVEELRGTSELIDREVWARARTLVEATASKNDDEFIVESSNG